MTDKFSTSVIINADPAAVWTTLTHQGLMSEWMGEPEMGVAVHTNWKVNTPILISGFHHVKFVAKGVILQYDEEKTLRYSHLSSVSRLPDAAENYTILEFVLKPSDEQTQLTLNIENFPTETIRKHLEFYWRTTIVKIKKKTEEKQARHNWSLKNDLTISTH